MLAAGLLVVPEAGDHPTDRSPRAAVPEIQIRDPEDRFEEPDSDR